MAVAPNDTRILLFNLPVLHLFDVPVENQRVLISLCTHPVDSAWCLYNGGGERELTCGHALL